MDDDEGGVHSNDDALGMRTGGGGCAFTLLGLDRDEEGHGGYSGEEGQAAALKKQLEEQQGFVCVETVLGGPGVMWDRTEESAPSPVG